MFAMLGNEIKIKNEKTKVWLAFILLLIAPLFSWSQQQNIPLNHQFYQVFERALIQQEEVVHTSFKPIIQSKARAVSTNDSLLFTSLTMKSEKHRGFIERKLFYNHLIFVDSNNIQLSIDPIMELELGNERIEDPRSNVESYYKNTRGVIVRLNVGDKLSIESSFRENQAVVPYYIAQRASFSKTAYGQGRYKNFKNGGYDYAMASAYVSYSPIEKINIQAGHGKHFVGEGYRSLLLSDLAFNYPFFRLQTEWFNGKLSYQNMYAIFQDMNRVLMDGLNEEIFERKQAAFHYLSYQPSPNFNISFFEGIIYPSLDTSGNIVVPATYWIPLLGINSAVNGQKKQLTTTLGTNVSWNLFKRLKLYGQLSSRNTKIKQFGTQLGAKVFLGQSWTVHLEYNKGKNLINNNYTHYGESLNHPATADFEELITGIYFHKNRWLSKLSYNKLKMRKYQVNYIDARQSFIVNPSYNLTLNIGVQNRTVDLPYLSAAEKELPLKKEIVSEYAPYGGVINSTYFYFSISTNLQNKYFDY